MAPSTPLRRPGSYFREPPSWAQDLRAPYLIAAAAPVSVAVAFAVVGAVVQATTGAAAGGFDDVGLRLAATTVASFCGVFVVFGTWFLYYDGTGSFTGLVGMIAWGTVVYALAWGVVALMLGYAVASGTALPEGATLGDVDAALGSLGPYAGLVLLLAGIWAWLLWYCGLRYRHGLQDGLATKVSAEVLAFVPVAPLLVAT